MKMSKRKKSNRKIDIKDFRERILIVCEGEKTEPNYFKAFQIDENRYYVKPMGEGYNTISLVKRAKEIRDTSSKLLPFDIVWCVFDRDGDKDGKKGFSAQNFNNAFEIAKNNNIEIAYSNDAFELWYYLHFHYHEDAESRDWYINQLNKLLGHEYEKNSDKMYGELKDKQDTAIRNAKRLIKFHLDSKGKNVPEKDNPSTTVYELVEELNKRLQTSKI